MRYKTSIDVEEVDLVEPMVRHLIYANVLTMDKYFNALLRVISGEVSPTVAIQEVEGGA